VPLTLCPGYLLFLGLEGFEDAIPFLLDDIVLDSAPRRPPFGPASMKTFVMFFSPNELLTVQRKPRVGK
jgi:hypothetical protein